MALLASYSVGQAIAEGGNVLITGATSGVPYAAALGAKAQGGISVGISPAANPREHATRYRKPADAYDSIVYTNMGYNGREPINVSTCDGIIFIGGEFGTLIEFGQGFYDGKILGVLEGVGGISDKIGKIVSFMETDWGSTIIYNSNPKALVREITNRVSEFVRSTHSINDIPTDLGEDVKKLVTESYVNTKR